MTPPLHEHRARRRRWRLGTPVVFAVAGALFIVSAANSEGIDLRPGGTTDLAGLVRIESQHVEGLQRRARELSDQVDRLSEAVNDRQVREAQETAEKMRAPAGFTEVRGDGIEVVLEDAPIDLRASSEQDINLLVVHQQDIQAVVNAMWRAGAEAITIKGQRIISTTGIKCIGNTVELHGIPYSQPYEIKAIGDPDALEAGIDADSYLSVYREQAERPDIQIGWEMERVDELTAPAFDGTQSLEFARPAG